MDYKINFVKKTRKEWLKEMPDVIYNLKKNYNFYYACDRPSIIKKEITEVINKGYNKSKISRELKISRNTIYKLLKDNV